MNGLEPHGFLPADVKGVLGVQYRALGVLFDPLRILWSDPSYMGSIYDGVSKFVSMIEDEELSCPMEKLVLVGYSQGALALHIALRVIAAADPAELSPTHIGAVLMVADLAKVGNALKETWQGDQAVAGAGVLNAKGIWTTTPGLPDQGPLPASVVGSTLAICHNHDIVCAPGSGSNVDNHTNHTGTEMDDMGLWAANLMLANYGTAFSLTGL